jgi:hypothetical protein
MSQTRLLVQDFLSKHIMFITTLDMAGCIEINCGRDFSEFLQNK